MKFNRILFPVDFSEYSLSLNAQVEWLARRFNSNVTLLHVFEIPSSWYGGADAPMLSGEDIVAFANDEKQRLQEYSIHIPESRIERVSLEGGAAWHIANWAKEHASDLVVMGTHGFGALRRMLLGSVAMKVLHDVDCPVWTQAPKQTGCADFIRSRTSSVRSNSPKRLNRCCDSPRAWQKGLEPKSVCCTPFPNRTCANTATSTAIFISG